MAWDGEERRKMNTDHDTLTEIVQILKSHVENFDKHVIDDKVNFGKIDNKIDNHAKYIYIGMGIIGVLEVLMKH